MQITFGLHAAFLNSYLSGVIVTQAVGKAYVGYFTALAAGVCVPSILRACSSYDGLVTVHILILGDLYILCTVCTGCALHVLYALYT